MKKDKILIALHELHRVVNLTEAAHTPQNLHAQSILRREGYFDPVKLAKERKANAIRL